MMTQIVSQTMGQAVSIKEKQAQIPAEAPVVAPILTPTMTQSVSPTFSNTMMTQIGSQTMTQTVPPNETYALTRFAEPCVSQTMRLSESTNYNVSVPIVTQATLEELEKMVQKVLLEEGLQGLDARAELVDSGISMTQGSQGFMVDQIKEVK